MLRLQRSSIRPHVRCLLRPAARCGPPTAPRSRSSPSPACVPASRQGSRGALVPWPGPPRAGRQERVAWWSAGRGCRGRQPRYRSPDSMMRACAKTCTRSASWAPVSACGHLPRLGAAGLGETLFDRRQAEGQGLAGAGLGQPQDVMTVQRARHRRVWIGVGSAKPGRVSAAVTAGARPSISKAANFLPFGPTGAGCGRCGKWGHDRACARRMRFGAA